MLNDFKKILKEYYDIDNVSLNSNFKTEFGLTSFDFINLICLIEEKYNIEIEEKKYRTLNTIDDLIKYIEHKNEITNK